MDTEELRKLRALRDMIDDEIPTDMDMDPDMAAARAEPFYENLIVILFVFPFALGVFMMLFWL